jgi:hypothetical protein
MKGDAIAQMATEYTPAEIVYFKAIVRKTFFSATLFSFSFY